jgi:hypothetical protein
MRIVAFDPMPSLENLGGASWGRARCGSRAQSPEWSSLGWLATRRSNEADKGSHSNEEAAVTAWCEYCKHLEVFIHDHVRHDEMCGMCGARTWKESR